MTTRDHIAELEAAALAAESRLRDALIAVGVEDRHLPPLWAATSSVVKARMRLLAAYAGAPSQ